MKKLDVFRGEGIEATACEIQRAESTAVVNQRDAADGLHAFRAKGADDFGVERIEFAASRDEGLVGGDGAAGGRGFTWHERLRLEDVLFARKIEGVNFEQAGLGIEEGEAGVVVMDDAFDGGNDTAEQFGEFAAGNEDIVDFEKDLEAIAFAHQLRMIGLGRGKVQGVIDGDGDLAGDALHELEFSVRDALGDETAETHGAEAMLSGGERKNREGADIVGAVALQEFGEARFLFDITGDKGLLRLPDPSGGIALDGRLRAGDFFAGDARFENVKAHYVLGGVVKDEGEEIEVDDGMEAAGKVVEKRGKIALLGDSLADFEQGFELTPGMFKRGGERQFRRGDDGFRHRKEDNIWVGGGSTGAGTNCHSHSSSARQTSRKTSPSNEKEDEYFRYVSPSLPTGG